MASSSVPKLYHTVIEDVINNVREAFIDEGVDEQALTELKQVWERKLHESKAIEREEAPVTKILPHPSLQPVQQTTTIGSSATITHQLAMPTGNMIPQTLLQYNPGSNDLQKAVHLPGKVTLSLPAHMAQTGLQTLVSAPGTTHVQLPPEFASLFQGNIIASASNNLQQGTPQIYQAITTEQLKNAQQFTVTIPVTTQQSQPSVVSQIDGANDTSDDEDDDDFQDNDDDRDDNDDEQNEDDIGEEDEEPLNSDDDVSEDDPSDLFDTENVVVCQYDKITRSKNRWKFHLKDGIMNLQGKDFVFQKALGDSEW
ncbi:transcription initiation factor IIA subunit 1 [Trichonephila clavata]|uniref:Transcription initiation factor IIA subunit 1 n=1 Tax=Trichonephila clavata TaxID=2740835 RepID=A0A8X6FZL9_TRICU|nr:transcription initiation factor IIA subunit 1 [Trichonephila clavata]